MQNVGAWDYLDKPFVFSLEAETQYFFLQTGSEQETVFHYDENRKVVRSSNMCFSEYLAHIVERYPSGRGICRGDLLNI
jgi:hypothetical protein